MLRAKYCSPLGDIIVIVEGNELIYCNWDDPACESKLRRTLEKAQIVYEENSDGREEKTISLALTQLSEYFSGERIKFDLPLKLIGTSFQKRVWEILAEIPNGETRSYLWVARQIENPQSVRAVAMACGANPIALMIPCHRVISSSGRIGGYTGGIDRKVSLLELERISKF